MECLCSFLLKFLFLDFSPLLRCALQYGTCWTWEKVICATIRKSTKTRKKWVLTDTYNILQLLFRFLTDPHKYSVANIPGDSLFLVANFPFAAWLHAPWIKTRHDIQTILLWEHIVRMSDAINKMSPDDSIIFACRTLAYIWFFGLYSRFLLITLACSR